MFELSENRLRNDEIELHYYGFNSTQIYIQYRQSIDKRLKLVMLELSNLYNEMEIKDPETVSEILIKQYNDFWAAAEPTLQTFYEEIQNCLALPKNFVPESLTSPQDVFCDTEVAEIEKEIECLEEQYRNEKYYLHALKQRKELIETSCIPLKTQCDLAAKLFKENIRKVETFDALNAKRVERMGKYLESFDKKALLECMWKKGKSEAKEKENMDIFLKIIEKNKNESEGHV